jgi:hypothetical protein
MSNFTTQLKNMANFDNLKRLMDALKNISFFERIFGWKKIKNLMIDAAGDLSSAELKANEQATTIASLKNQQLLLQQEKQSLDTRRQEIDKAKDRLQQALEHLQDDIEKLQKENAILNSVEETRKSKHESTLASLEAIQTRIQKERADEIEQRNAAAIEKLVQLKQTWSSHENNVKGTIRSIALRHTIDYIDKVPFKGTPDNTLFICEEYVVFDAKSPAGEDLKNFPSYIREQAEKANKYAKQPDVKTDIYFVVPTNTLDILRQFVYNFSDHTVYVIAVDALEPVILSLKKIEEYEFAKELTPEDRSNICRILGRFAHLSKRRIQIDSFFAKQFIELVYKAESSLPPDILEMVTEFERSEKLNPPQEKRIKSIPTADLEKEIIQVKYDADGKGIKMEDDELSDKLNQHPLYNK